MGLLSGFMEVGPAPGSTWVAWPGAWSTGAGLVLGSIGVVLELGPIGVDWGHWGGQPGAEFCGLVSAYFTGLLPSEAYFSVLAGKVTWVM